MMQRASRMIHELWGEVRNNRKNLVLTAKVGFYIFVIDGAIFIVLALTAINFLDWKLIISMTVAEVPIGVFVSILLGERRGQPYRAVERLNAMAKFSHLYIHWAQPWLDADYPGLAYYVVNTRTNRAFWVQDILWELVKGGILRGTKHESREELIRYFEQNHITLEEKYGSLEDLGLVSVVLPEERVTQPL